MAPRQLREMGRTCLKRQALAAGLKPPNHKRVYRVMNMACCSIAMLAVSSGPTTVALRLMALVLRRLRDRL
jgi:hypothetical protein